MSLAADFSVEGASVVEAAATAVWLGKVVGK
jgi:hypothetical protein